jgi:hypothetical protein
MPLVHDDFKTEATYKKALAKNIGAAKNGKFLYLKIKFDDKTESKVLVFGQFHDVLKKHFEEQKATVLDKGTITDGVFQFAKGKPEEIAKIAKGIKIDFGVEVAVAGGGAKPSEDGKKENSQVVVEEKEGKEQERQEEVPDQRREGDGLDKNQPLPGLSMTVGAFLNEVTALKAQLDKVKYPAIQERLNKSLDDLVEQVRKQNFSKVSVDYTWVKEQLLQVSRREADIARLKPRCKKPEHLELLQVAKDALSSGDLNSAASAIARLDVRIGDPKVSEEDQQRVNESFAKHGLAKNYEHVKAQMVKAATKLEDKDDRKAIAEFVKKSLTLGLWSHLEKIDGEAPGPKRDRKIEETIPIVQTYIQEARNVDPSIYTELKNLLAFLTILEKALKELRQGTPT